MARTNEALVDPWANAASSQEEEEENVLQKTRSLDIRQGQSGPITEQKKGAFAMPNNVFGGGGDASSNKSNVFGGGSKASGGSGFASVGGFGSKPGGSGRPACISGAESYVHNKRGVRLPPNSINGATTMPSFTQQQWDKPPPNSNSSFASRGSNDGGAAKFGDRTSFGNAPKDSFGDSSSGGNLSSSTQQSNSSRGFGRIGAFGGAVGGSPSTTSPRIAAFGESFGSVSDASVKSSGVGKSGGFGSRTTTTSPKVEPAGDIFTNVGEFSVEEANATAASPPNEVGNMASGVMRRAADAASFAPPTTADGDGSLDEDAKPQSLVDGALLNKFLHQKLVEIGEVQIDLKVIQSDCESPLFSLRTFEELRLRDELLKGVYEMGFNQPSRIQEHALPILLCEPPQNMIAQSQSGTGKTAAFALTMLSRVDADSRFPQCLCLAPTYELALQIGAVVERMGQFLESVKVRYAVKGNRVGRGQILDEQIIIGTPGTVLDWMLKFRVIDPGKIKVFVLDEADVMISQQGHQDQSIRIHNAIQKSGGPCQFLLFSATYDPPVANFADELIPNASVITVRREQQTLDNIKQYYVDCPNREAKFDAICNLYGTLTIGSAIIFCYTRRSTEWLSQRMKDMRHATVVLNGDMDVADRARIIEQFKAGEHKVLITTNVCARGIDAQQVSIVVNYDPPMTMDRQPDFETYLHRIGRTGRFGKAGIAVNFCDGPQSRAIIHAIENHFGKPIKKLDTNDFDALEAIDNEN